MIQESYLTVEEANEYFNSRLNSETWFSSLSEERERALAQATELIDQLNFKGYKTNKNQVLEFPRNDDLIVPIPIKKACCIIAQKFLEGMDLDLEIENSMKTATKFHSAISQYDRSWLPEYLQAGVPSAEAWSYLKPYTIDPKQITISRI